MQKSHLHIPQVLIFTIFSHFLHREVFFFEINSSSQYPQSFDNLLMYKLIRSLSILSAPGTHLEQIQIFSLEL
jgi:hypothetical protein